jgi:acetyltransferase-like isoleucine patch superfamily enzyme
MIKKISRKIVNTPFYLVQKVQSFFYSFKFGEFGIGSIINGKVYVVGPSNIFIGKNCSFGPNCRIETYANYGEQSLKPKLIIGDNCSIQHAVHIYCAKKVEIRKGCLIASGCMITDENHGMDPLKGYYISQPLLIKPTLLDEGVWLGENVCVLPGVTIGKYCVIGANSVVKRDIPDYSIAVGNPAKVVKQYNFETQNWEKV